MGVITTPNFYKALTFDGASSRTYGVYITGEAVYNAPERAVEMITIPGRNGAFALDQGRFENIEVSYPAGIFAETEADFAEAISDFRNLLCSKRGYVRLTDEYNPDEYRLAVYKSGLEVDPAQLIAGEFEIVFDCKPQRFLTSGETKTTINSGGTIANPTLFDAAPTLEVTGYGAIHFNGFDINVENATLGEVVVADSRFSPSTPSKTFAINDDLFNNGDPLRIVGEIPIIIAAHGPSATVSVTSQSATNTNADFDVSISTFKSLKTSAKSSGSITYSGDFVLGTNKTITNTCTITASGTATGVGSFSCTWTFTQTITYNAGAKTITVAQAQTSTSNKAAISANYSGGNHSVTITGDSSISVLGNPTYINCDLGFAYMIKGGEVVGLNRYIDLGSELPNLAPGSNTITFDNTITQLKVTPNWWKV